VSESAPEILFYQLEREPLDRVLPKLLERSLSRGWRAMVRIESAERLDALDAVLWTYDDASFLPHGKASEQAPERQPVLLSLDGENRNGAQVLFITDGGALGETGGYARVAYLFDGGDGAAKERAREEWRAAKAKGAAVTFWRQEPDGRWTQAG
jgi:DNA polymerase-3 subunit chi